MSTFITSQLQYHDFGINMLLLDFGSKTNFYHFHRPGKSHSTCMLRTHKPIRSGLIIELGDSIGNLIRAGSFIIINSSANFRKLVLRYRRYGGNTNACSRFLRSTLCGANNAVNFIRRCRKASYGGRPPIFFITTPHALFRGLGLRLSKVPISKVRICFQLLAEVWSFSGPLAGLFCPQLRNFLV